MNVESINQTLINSISIVIYFVYFSCIGSTVSSYLYNESSKTKLENFVRFNIIGLFVNYIILAIWNLFQPLNYLIFLFTIIITLPSIYSFIQYWFDIKIEKKSNNSLWIPILIQIIFILWISNLSLKTLIYEEGYYIQKIRWAQQYPLIPGLGNLFDHYGLDSSLFLYVAILERIPLFNGALWNFSGYLFSLGFLYFFVIPFHTTYRNKYVYKASDLMRVIFTPILINYCFYMHPGPNNDIPIFIFGSFLSIEFFRMIFENNNNFDVILMCILIGFTSKLSFLPAATFCILFIILNNLYGLYGILRKHRYILFLSILTITLQLHRNIVLTGYPLFPFDGISVPVKWKMDEEKVISLSKSITDWAKGKRVKNTDINLRKIKYDWMKSRLFIQHKRIELFYPLILAIIGLLYVLYKKSFNWKKYLIFSIPAMSQMMMWFFYAPDSRFSSFGFWWLGSGLFCFIIKDLFQKLSFWIIALILLLLSFSIHTIDYIGSKKNILIYKPSNYSILMPDTFKYKTKSELEVFVPKRALYCGDSPLPCTTTPDSNLSLIKKDSIEYGFYLND